MFVRLQLARILDVGRFYAVLYEACGQARRA
jgi:hypothetical protein